MSLFYPTSPSDNSSQPPLLKKERVWLKLMSWGRKTGCHQRYDRSFFYKNFQFPICARCTGIFLSQWVTVISLPFLLKFFYHNVFLFIALWIVSLLILGIDGLGQLGGYWESNNIRRVLSGFGAGLFSGYLWLGLLIYVGSFLLTQMT